VLNRFGLCNCLLIYGALFKPSRRAVHLHFQQKLQIGGLRCLFHSVSHDPVYLLLLGYKLIHLTSRVINLVHLLQVGQRLLFRDKLACHKGIDLCRRLIPIKVAHKLRVLMGDNFRCSLGFHKASLLLEWRLVASRVQRVLVCVLLRYSVHDLNLYVQQVAATFHLNFGHSLAIKILLFGWLLHHTTVERDLTHLLLVEGRIVGLRWVKVLYDRFLDR
jgi:hypothetical protein